MLVLYQTCADAIDKLQQAVGGYVVSCFMREKVPGLAPQAFCPVLPPQLICISAARTSRSMPTLITCDISKGRIVTLHRSIILV